MSDEWQVGTRTLPGQITLTGAQRETIRADLWQVGIVEDPFVKSPENLKFWLQNDKSTALALYAAIKHAVSGSYELTVTFDQWARGLGIEW